MAFLTLFRVATGDNWNGIMKVINFRPTALWTFAVSRLLVVASVLLNANGELI